jgi:lipoate-protein ligase A
MGRGVLINSGALEGAANMAFDAWLLDEVARSQEAVLRLYRWARPTLSLGYFQKLEDVADEAFMAGRGLDWVRRPTGGGAILHDQELTFSLCLPAGHPALKGSVNDSYLNLTRPLLGILRKLGIEAAFRGEGPQSKAANCFAGAACPDLVVAGKKVFGSAQRRKEKAVLMHGSLLFVVDEALWQGVFLGGSGGGFAGIGHASQDWASLLKKAYANELNLDFSGVLAASAPYGQGGAAVLK